MSLSKFDDYLIHQVAQPMGTLGTTDPHFMDRLWFMSYTADGTLQMMAGLGSYPNGGIMDGFLLVRHNGIQRNFRASRHLNGPDDRANTVIGPLAFEIVEPQKKWKIRLDDNEFGISCALDFEARTAPFLFPRLGFKEQEQLHYKQPGYSSGHITFEDKKFDVSRMSSVRDRSWGVRKPGLVGSLDICVVVEAHFASGGATLIYVSNKTFSMCQGALLGDDGSVTEIKEMKQRVEFIEGTSQFKRVELQLLDTDGKKRRLVATAIAPQCFFTGGGYDGRHGLDRGPFHLEGERWDVAKDAGAASIFPYYSRIVEIELDGEPGIGHVEAYFSQAKDWVYTSDMD